jgi:hypothetical protein
MSRKPRPWFDFFDATGYALARRIPKDAVLECSAPGPCDDAVDYWIGYLGFEAPEAPTRAYLKTFGAWDDDELSDHAVNTQRLFWSICHDIRAEKYA